MFHEVIDSSLSSRTRDASVNLQIIHADSFEELFRHTPIYLGKVIQLGLYLCLHNYRPQTRFAKVMFSQVSVCQRAGGVSQHALGRGCIPACTGQGVCIPACTGQGVCIPACTGQGVCIPACTGQGGVCPGGVADTPRGQRQTPPTPWRILQDMVNKRAVHIPLECILVRECSF